MRKPIRRSKFIAGFILPIMGELTVALLQNARGSDKKLPMKQTSSDVAWVLDVTAVETLLQEIGFREEIIQFIRQASCEVAQSDDVAKFLQACRSWPQNPQQFSGGVFPSSWKALAVVSKFPATFEKHRALGVPREISNAMLCDMQRHMDYSDGSWHFANMNWLSNHLGGEFFEIGRLQYHLGTFGNKVRVYRDSVSGEIVPLALGGRRCTTEGWPRDDADAFETRLEEREDGIFGHPISPENGSISPKIKRLSPDSIVLLNEQSAVANVHIPSGAKLEPAACRASLTQARDFFAKYFPQVKIQGYATATWLLDRELAAILPPDSNIAAFGLLFRPLPQQNANDHQLLERAFGRDATWENCRAVSSLQKAVLKHHQAGGEFRMTAGFILPEDIAAFSSADDKE